MILARPTLPVMLQRAAFALFALTMLLSINAVNLRAGPIPIRSVTLLLSGLLLFLPDPGLIRRSMTLVRRLTMVIVAVGVLGFVVSMLARNVFGGAIEQVIELHVQAFIGLIIACGLMLRFGMAPVIFCLFAAFAITALFGIGQALHINAAWQARASLGSLMHDTEAVGFTYRTRYRATGLSFSPVHFGTHSCLALATFVIWRFSKTDSARIPFDWQILVATIVFAALCVLTGNRSPLLGFLLFGAVYCAVTAPRVFIAMLPLALLAALAAGPLLRTLDDAGLRVADVDNKSAAGRATLRAFGMYLIGQRPIGYGMTFVSMDYWTSFGHQANYLENPLGIRLWALHNYYLTVLAKYGILLLAFLPLVLPRSRRGAFLWMAFIPYCVHIFYHNDGPLQGDFLFFYFIPAALIVSERWGKQAREEQRARARRPWRRAFARPELAA